MSFAPNLFPWIEAVLRDVCTRLLGYYGMHEWKAIYQSSRQALARAHFLNIYNFGSAVAGKKSFVSIRFSLFAFAP